MVDKTFNFIVNGGQATGGPPIGPALGPLGVNIMQIVNKINEETSEYQGLPVPVDIIIDTDTREFEVQVGMLTTFALISQATGIKKGSGSAAPRSATSWRRAAGRPCARLPRPGRSRRSRARCTTG